MVMWAWVIAVVACVASGTLLVLHDHYGYAWIPFVLAAAFPYTRK